MKIKIKEGAMVLGVLSVTMLVVTIIFGVHPLKPKAPIQSRAAMKNHNFQSKNPVLDFTFEYPEKGWQPVEAQGSIEKYDQVYLQGPVNKENGFTTLIHATVRPLEVGKTAPDLLEACLKTDSNLTKFRILHKDVKEVGREKAFSVVYEYESFPLFNMKAPPVLLRGQRVYLMRNGRSYELMIETVAAQYKDYAPIFENVLKTFKFKK